MPLIAALAFVAFQAGALPAAQQQPPPAPAEPPKKEKKEKKAKKPKEKKEKSYPFFRLGDHPSIHFEKGTHLDFRARFAWDKADSDAPVTDSGETSAVDLGKKRIGISGEIRNAVEFQIESELETGSGDQWRDVYADFKKYDVARVRGGNFKLPFSLDENTGASHLDFLYRSLAATHLAPGRAQGVMVHGRVWNKVVAYEVGVFEHDGRNARTNNKEKVYGGQTPAARVTVEPLRNQKDAIGDLSIGAAFTTSTVPEGIPGLRGHTVLDQNFFSSGNFIVNGTRRRTGVEFMFRPGPASIKAEWMRAETQRKGESVADTDLSPLIGEGWYVSGTCAITGEKKADVDKPNKPLLQGGFGAVEVAARVESLEFKSGASGETGSRSPRADVILGNRDQVTTVGVNWYVNRFFKIQVNLINEKLDDPSQGPLPSKASFSTKVFRFQFSL